MYRRPYKLEFKAKSHLTSATRTKLVLCLLFSPALWFRKQLLKLNKKGMKQFPLVFLAPPV